MRTLQNLKSSFHTKDLLSNKQLVSKICHTPFAMQMQLGARDLKIHGEIEKPRAERIKENRIHVSNSQKPLFFYINLSKKYLKQHSEVELSGLGMAVSTVVSIAEILKNEGFVVEKSIKTLAVEMRDDPGAGTFPKIEVLLGKSANFDELMAAEEDLKESGEGAKKK